MKTLIVGALLVSGAALAQNPAPITWVSPPSFLDPRGADFELDNVAVGDLTADGLPDIVFLNRETGDVVLLPNGMGGRRWPEQLGERLTTNSRDGFIALGDINGDGHGDVALLDLSGAGALRTGLGQPGGVNAIAWGGINFDDIAPVRSSLGLSLGDVDGDGVLDVALNDPSYRVISFAGGNLQQLTLTNFVQLHAPLQFADFLRDGDVDGFGWLQDGPAVVRNDGALPWIPGGPGQGRLPGVIHMAIADLLPGDGLDLVASTNTHLYTALRRNGGYWEPWVQTPFPPLAEPVAVDVDGDGDVDVVGTVRTENGNLLYLDNDGAGGFRPQRLDHGNGGGLNDGRVWPADLDGDGSQDLVVSFNDGVTLWIFTTGQGVLGASHRAPPGRPITVAGRTRRRHGTITVTPLVPLPEAVAVTEISVRVEGAPAGEVLEAVEVVSYANGSPVVGRVEGDALQAEMRVPLAGDGLLVDDLGNVTLDLFFITRADAHQAAEEVWLSWESVSATFIDGEPAPVVSQIALAQAWHFPNAAPVAQADAFDVTEGGTALLDVLANDSDANGDPLTIEIVDGPTAGAVEWVDGQARYTHDGREAPPTDRFTYRALDPRREASEVVEVALTITPVNDAPVAAPDAYVTREDTPLVMDADLGLLVNDTDPDSEILLAVVDEPPATGELQLAPDGSFVYLPAPDAHGEVRFTYRVDDGDALSAPATVTITVLPDEDAPRPAEGPFRTGVDTPVVLQLAGADPEGGAAVLLIEGFPDHGYLVALQPDQGTVTYVPPAGFVGAARFAYRLTDRAVLSELFEAVVQVER